MVETPVVLIIFNRPQATARVIQALASVAPERVFVIADGPRSDHIGDAAACQAAQDVARTGISWPCAAEWNRSETNLGCKERIVTGLDWVFSHVGRAIILEDDCVPDPTFFPYCDELLDRYADDATVGSIVGTTAANTLALTPPDVDASYRFSRYNMSWGWATWRRAWELNDPDILAWPSLRDTSWLASHADTQIGAMHWRAVFNSAYDGLDAWDYSWTFSCWLQGLLTIHPRTNLVTNIGFGPDATHTLVRTPFAELTRTPLAFPLRHPPSTRRDIAYDAALEERFFDARPARLFTAARMALRESRR